MIAHFFRYFVGKKVLNFYFTLWSTQIHEAFNNGISDYASINCDFWLSKVHLLFKCHLNFFSSKLHFRRVDVQNENVLAKKINYLTRFIAKHAKSCC